MSERELLHKAIQNGDLESVKIILASGMTLDHLFGMRGTPLCAAISANQPDIVRHLINLDCDVNAKDFDGEPPLCLAIRKGYVDITTYLLKSDHCDPNKYDPVSGNTPLLLAVAKKQMSIIKLLLEKKCDINQSSKEGNCDMPLHKATLDGSLEIMDLLLSQPSCKVNSVNKKGLCPLHIAAEEENYDTMKRLLKCAEDCQTRDPLSCSDCLDKNKATVFDHFTALHLVVMKGNQELVQLLISSGCDINSVTQYQRTALHIACSNNMEDIAMLLLKAGADPNVVGLRPRFLPTRVSQQKTSTIQEAVTNGNLCLLKLLVCRGADINLQSHLGMTPLIFALMHNKIKIVEYFLTEGIKLGLDVTKENYEGDTALNASWFCEHSAEVAQKLIDAGCDVNKPNFQLKQPIHVAVSFECGEVVEVLLDNGAQVNAKDGDDMTPLHLATLCDTDHVARILLFYGADMTAIDEDGNTPFQLALNIGAVETIELIMKCGYNASGEDFLLLDQDQEEFPDVLEEEPELYNWLVHCARNPLSLSVQCASAIRQHFCRLNIPMKRTRELPLPCKLLNIVMVKNF